MKKTLKIISAVLAATMLLPMIISCSSGKKAFEYKGYKITEGMYSYWMKSWKDHYVNYYSDISDTPEYWSAKNESGQTNEDYLTEQIETRIIYYLVAQKLFDDYKLKLDKQTLDKVKSDISDQTEYYGSKSAFNDFLKSEYGINISVLEDIYIMEDKYTAVYNYLYGTSGKNSATPEELDRYYQDYFVRVRYVMFFKKIKYRLDEDGKKVTDPQTGYYAFDDLTDEEMAKVRENADEVYKNVSEGKDISEYMKMYMKDFGYDEKSYPNGYYISADNYAAHTADVTSAALEMKVGDVRFIENETCYFVVQKFDLIDKAYSKEPDSNQFTDLVSYCNNLKFSNEFSAYAEDVVRYRDITEKYKIGKI